MYSGRGGREFGGGSGGEGGPKPVKVGDELDVTIEAKAARGDGLAKKDGFVIFVKGTEVGQTVRIRVTDVRERFATAEVAGAASAQEPAPGEPAAAPAEPAEPAQAAETEAAPAPEAPAEEKPADEEKPAE